MIDFPSSPFIGQQYSEGTRTWAWNGSGWERLIAAGQNIAVFVLVGPVVVDAEIFVSPPAPEFVLLNHI